MRINKLSSFFVYFFKKIALRITSRQFTTFLQPWALRSKAQGCKMCRSSGVGMERSAMTQQAVTSRDLQRRKEVAVFQREEYCQ
jgi:hypothetical protein